MRKKATIMVFSGDFEKAYAAFRIANGAAAAVMDVTLYFTFYGLNLIKKGGLKSAPLSKKNMLGIGNMMMKKRLKDKGMPSIEELMKDAKELGVKFLACDASMDMFSITRDDLIDEVDEVVGVGTYIRAAKNSEITLFI